MNFKLIDNDVDDIDDADENDDVHIKFHILHACSGPDRPHSLRRCCEEINVSCLDFDIIVDAALDLVDDHAWTLLHTDVKNGVYHGMVAGPVCTTFSNVRGLAGGPLHCAAFPAQGAMG